MGGEVPAWAPRRWEEELAAPPEIKEDAIAKPRFVLEGDFASEWKAAAESLSAQPSLVTRPLEGIQRAQHRHRFYLYSPLLLLGVLGIWYLSDTLFAISEMLLLLLGDGGSTAP